MRGAQEACDRSRVRDAPGRVRAASGVEDKDPRWTPGLRIWAPPTVPARASLQPEYTPRECPARHRRVRRAAHERPPGRAADPETL